MQLAQTGRWQAQCENVDELACLQYDRLLVRHIFPDTILCLKYHHNTKHRLAYSRETELVPWDERHLQTSAGTMLCADGLGV